jgi:hypothetical protein
MASFSDQGESMTPPAPHVPPTASRYRQLRVCSGGGGFEAVPTGSVSLDLTAVRTALERQGVDVVDARVILIASLEVEVTVSRAGRLLFKTRDMEAAARAFERLRPLVDPGALARG